MPVTIYNKSKTIDGEIGLVDNTTWDENTVYDDQGYAITLAPNERRTVSHTQNLGFVGLATTTLGQAVQNAGVGHIVLDKDKSAGAGRS